MSSLVLVPRAPCILLPRLYLLILFEGLGRRLFAYELKICIACRRSYVMDGSGRKSKHICICHLVITREYREPYSFRIDVTWF
ncbi:hypothetical protein DFH27DRAFT_574936 [Peziza echinospora]|nr:hypothetical protein DFH27DRAFT_574936 [Peziza echinospora]